MGEKLEIYDLEGNLVGVQERKEFYDEIRKEFAETGKITKLVRSVRVLVMNSEGRIYIQRRSRTKAENAGLYDKTVGGHVSAGQTWDIALIRECAEELGFPAAVVSGEEFTEAAKSTDLTIIGLFKKIEVLKNFISKRVSQDTSSFEQPYVTAIYFGYYDGAIRFVDGESSGIQVFSLEELKEEMEERPEAFTEDLKFLIKKYAEYLVPLEQFTK